MVFALLTSRPLFAQSTTEGAIGGLVVDQSKGTLPGVTVNARNVATNGTASTTTDESGHFTVIRLQPGTYAVEVTLGGFAPYTRTSVVVEVGRVTNLDITMGVARQTESVNIVAEAPVINRESADLSTNINQTSINNRRREGHERDPLPAGPRLRIRNQPGGHRRRAGRAWHLALTGRHDRRHRVVRVRQAELP